MMVSRFPLPHGIASLYALFRPHSPSDLPGYTKDSFVLNTSCCSESTIYASYGFYLCGKDQMLRFEHTGAIGHGD